MMGLSLHQVLSVIVIWLLKKKNYLKDTKMNSSNLSKVSHLATNQSNDKQTAKENLLTEEARKYLELSIRLTSAEKTSLSNAKDEQTNPSQ